MQNFPNSKLNFPKLNFTNIPKTPTFYAPITSTTYTHSIPINPYHPISSRNHNLIFNNINSYRSSLPQQLILNSYRPPQLSLYNQTTSRNANQPVPLTNTSIQVNTSGNLTARSNPKRNDVTIQPGITNEIELLDIKLKCDLISHKLTKLKDIVIPTTHSNIKKFRTRNYNFEHITFKAKRTPLNYGNGNRYKRDNKSFDTNINVIYHRDDNDNDNKEHNKLKQQKECEDLSDIVDNIVETFDVERSGEKENESKKSKDNNNIEMIETFADVVARSSKKSESGANSFKGRRVSIGSEKKYIEDDLNMCISDDYLRKYNEEDMKLLRSGNKKKVRKKIQKKVVKTIKTPKVHIIQFKEDKDGGNENGNEEEIEGEDEEIEEEVEEEVEIEVSDNEEQKQQCDVNGNGNDKKLSSALKHKKKKRKSKDKNEIINEDTNNNTTSTVINKDQGNVVNITNINNTAVNPNSDITNTTKVEIEKVKPPKEEENKKFKIEHKRAINSEEEADLIISQIMKTAQIHAEEDEIKLAHQLEEEAKEQLQQNNNTNTNEHNNKEQTNEPVQKQVKKGVTFSDESLIKIQYKSKDIITKLEIYDINDCQLPFKPHNMSRYITLLMNEHDEDKLKPCIVNTEHNSHLYSSLRSSTKSNKNKKKNLLSMNQKNMIRRNINKIQEISKRGCIYNIKSPKKKPEIKKQNCKKFTTNPQHFFTEKLCDRMYSAYNIHKTLNKDITSIHNTSSSSHLTRSYSPSQLHHMRINNNNNE